MNGLYAIQSQACYKIQSLAFNEDGSISAHIQFGVMQNMPMPDGQMQPQFISLAGQGYFVAKQELDGLQGFDVSKYASIKEAAEAQVLEVLKNKNSLPN